MLTMRHANATFTYSSGRICQRSDVYMCIWPPDDPEIFGPLITPGLASTIDEAVSLNAAFEAEADDKGPMGDGVPWKPIRMTRQNAQWARFQAQQSMLKWRSNTAVKSRIAAGLTPSCSFDMTMSGALTTFGLGTSNTNPKLKSVLAAVVDELTP